MQFEIRNVNLECVKDIAINRDVYNIQPVSASPLVFPPQPFDSFEEQREAARSLILSGIEIHASITDYFDGLASFEAVVNICC